LFSQINFHFLYSLMLYLLWVVSVELGEELLGVLLAEEEFGGVVVFAEGIEDDEVLGDEELGADDEFSEVELEGDDESGDVVAGVDEDFGDIVSGVVGVGFVCLD
jgi:hypothetical protein